MKRFTYDEAVRYIEDIPKFTKEKSSDNTACILKMFGNPELSFTYIHVAGTNGKGSVCAFLAGILKDTGCRTGLFTSPHLVETTERIRVDGEMISKEDFADIFNDLYEAVTLLIRQGRPHPTYFEWIYIMCMIYFGRRKVKYGVIETGLGGRLDATNAVSRPAVTVITSISYDHMQILGDTIEKIAAEKAGIIKENVPVIADGSNEKALQVIRDTAEKKHAPLIAVKPEQIKKILNTNKGIDFCFEDEYHKTYDIELSVKAVYQTMNAAIAFTAARQLKVGDESLASLSDKDIINSLSYVKWPARFQKIEEGIYLDGAHNEDGMRQLVNTVNFVFDDQPVWILFAVSSDKTADSMLMQLKRLKNLKGMIITQLNNERRTGLDILSGILEDEGFTDVYLEPDLHVAFELAKSLKKNDILICAGSLYLAGSISSGLS